jgi:hypothetical protein
VKAVRPSESPPAVDVHRRTRRVPDTFYLDPFVTRREWHDGTFRISRCDRESLDLGHLGYGMVAVSVLIWAGAAIVSKTRIQPKERA